MNRGRFSSSMSRSLRIEKSWTDRPHRQRLQGNLMIWLIRYVTGHIDSIQLLSHLPCHCEPYSGVTGFSSLLNMSKTVNLLASDNSELDKMSEGKLWLTESMCPVHRSWFQISRSITLQLTGATYYCKIQCVFRISFRGFYKSWTCWNDHKFADPPALSLICKQSRKVR